MPSFRSTLTQALRALVALAALSVMAIGAFAQGVGVARGADSGQAVTTFTGRVALNGQVRGRLLAAPPALPVQLRRMVGGLDRDGDGMPDRNELPDVPEGPFVRFGSEPPPSPTLRGREEKGSVHAQANTDAVSLRTLTSLNAGAHGNSTAVVLEPTTASNGSVVMYAGNSFAAVSTNAGAGFAYLNPYTLFPASDGGFCCHQVLRYVPSIDRFVWLLQYAKNGSSENRHRVATASSAQVAAGQWSYFDLTSQSLGVPSQWLDFPALGVSSGFLYLTTNVFNAADNFTRSSCLRFALSDIADGGAATFDGFSVNDATSLHPSQNGGTRAFIATHNSTSSLRLYHWDDTAAAAVRVNVTIPSWSQGPYSSTTPDGFNWLGRVDSRISAVTVAGGEVWVAWTAAAGGAYSLPQPYANIVRVHGTTFAFLGDDRMIQLGAVAAAAYPALSTNANGEVGVAYAWGGGGTAFPNTSIGFLTGGDRRQFTITPGTHGPQAQAWGDSLTIRVDAQNPKHFSATGYSLVGGSTDGFAVPVYVRFGRASDTTGTFQPDVYEPDGSVGVAKALSVGQTQFHNMHAIGDQDFTTFTLATAATITLRTHGDLGDTVMTLYGPDNPANELESDDDDGTQSFSLITRDVTAGTYWVKVEEFENNDTLPGYSLALTAIVPTVLVTAPDGGETFTANTTQNITWTSASVSGNVKIELSTNGGSGYSTLIADTPNDGSHSWTVPNSPTTQGRIRVTMLDGSASDVSNADFTIAPPSITVTSPNGGETLTGGTDQTITWNSDGVSGNVLLEYSTNGGSAWNVIIASAANDGSEPWIVPNAASSQARVRVSTLDLSVTDQSDASFTIEPTPSSITVTSPNGGETLVAGAAHTITWTSVNVTGLVQLQFSSDGGSTWGFIADTANDGSESWTVPSVATTQARIRITAASLVAADTSNANFSIVLPSFTVTSPNGGEAYPINTAQTITWTSANAGGSVKLEYSSDGGANWTVLNAGTANDGAEGWTAPGTPTAQGRIRVSTVSGSVSDVSNANFAVTYVGGILKAPARINFGTVKRLKPKTKRVVIQNKSKTANLIVSFSTSGAPFSITSGTGPITIPPKKKLKVSVLFTPPAVGDYVGSFTVTSSDPANATKAIPATGKAR